jgi:hypothetical protein
VLVTKNREHHLKSMLWGAFHEAKAPSCWELNALTRFKSLKNRPLTFSNMKKNPERLRKQLAC